MEKVEDAELVVDRIVALDLGKAIDAADSRSLLPQFLLRRRRLLPQ